MNRTDIIRKRYNRNAYVYDYMDIIIRDKWRKQIYEGLTGEILEVGVGTGRNIPFYPANAHITGIDFSENMLERAIKRLKEYKANAKLILMDAQEMDFPNNSFDAVVTTCVFCTVPDPLKGFSEIKRVIKPNGEIRMLEHMRSDQPIMGKMMDMINPLVVGAIGTNINRDTMNIIKEAGLVVKDEYRIMGSMYRMLKLSPNK